MRVCHRTHQGLVRASNQDSLLAEGRLYGVADGMGGHKGGETASRVAVQVVKNALSRKKPEEDALRMGLEAANRRVYGMAGSDENLTGMGTTMTLLWEGERRILIGHVGDSRAYRLRDGKLSQITQDHSVVGELLRNQVITPEMAKKHPYRNIITRAVGIDPVVEVDVLSEDKQLDDLWLVCSDGLYNMVDDQDIEEILQTMNEEKAADRLLELALEHGGIGSALRFDGKLAAYLLNPSASGYEVHSLAAEYGVHAAFACEAAPDAGVLAGLCDTLAAALDESGQRKLLDEMELPLARVLADMERIGFAIDADGIRAFGDSLRSELDGILHNIYTEVGYEFNVNSPKQLGEALFDKLGLPPRKKNARGYSTDAETLESLRPYSPVIDEILKYRTYAKLLSTYVDGLLNAEAADGRVHSTFIQTEARTGRISSTEPNLQNIPIRTELGSRLRGYFVAGEGETLVDADYSQIELRILAHITGDEHMQQAFLNGADIHRSTAAKIYHIPESEVTPQLRSASKAINFGIMYGKGAYSLSKDLGIPVKEADTFLKTYLDTFPKVDGYMKDCIAHAKDKGYVETLFGRRRALPELASSNFQVRSSGERMARNTPIQGTAADIIKLAMVHVWQRLRDEKLQARLLLQVHDELIVEAPEEEIDEVKRILKEEMENVVHYSVPLTTEVGVGKTWLEAH